MKKGFFLRLFVLLMLTFFIAEQGRAQTYQYNPQNEAFRLSITNRIIS